MKNIIFFLLIYVKEKREKYLLNVETKRDYFLNSDE